MRAGRHGYRTDALGVIAALASLLAHEAHSTLPVFPRCLVDGQRDRARGAVDEVDTLETKLCKPLTPAFYVAHITAVLV